MKPQQAIFLPLFGSVLCFSAATRTANPVSKVLQLLSSLEAKIVKEGQDTQKVYEEYAELCEDRSKDISFEIKTHKAQASGLKATIEAEGATIEAQEGKIEEISAEIAGANKHLKGATEVRTMEVKDFKSEEAEVLAAIDTLQRAITILEGDSSFLQAQTTANLAVVLETLVKASALSTADTKRLTSLVQTEDEDEYADAGAPSAAAYEKHDGDIISTLEGLREKAEAQLDAIRSKETSELHNFEVMAQNLNDKISFANKELGESKKTAGESTEAKSSAEGDLSVTEKDLAASIEALEELHRDCMRTAMDFEEETKSRGEELKALAEAKKAIKETSGGADDVAYGLNQEEQAPSFVQVKAHASSDVLKFKALRYVRDLWRKYRSPALAQLRTRMSAALKSGSHDNFGKVKGLISDLIDKLLSEASSEATQKAFCDKEIAETTAKQDDKTEEIAKLTTKVDTMSSKSQQLKDEVASLQNQLAKLASSGAKMTKIRQEENAAYKNNKAELEEGLQGVKLALKILRDYYGKEDKGHEAAEGSATGILGLLEVVESDFTKSLAEIVATEEAAVAEFKNQSKENEIMKVTMDQDVKYKQESATKLDQAVSETGSDKDGVSSELDAINEYYNKLQEQCVAKAEPYEERVKRRNAEIAGLKEALEILSGNAVLLQSGSVKQLRG